MVSTTSKHSDSVKINFYKDTINDNLRLKYVVIISRYKDQWLFVKHRDRTTWEVPGGHIEADELPDDAARRELIEESSADDFNIRSICNYSVERAGIKRYGRLYYAEIYHLADRFEHEIQAIALFDDLPDQLTYPDIQPLLMAHVIEIINESEV